MKKRILSLYLFLATVSALLFSGCNTNDDGHTPVEGKPRFLVDKIYNYDHELMADYFYNSNDQLIKRSTYDPLNYPGIKIMDYELEYENNKIALIKNINYTHPQFSHDIKIIYDAQGRIIADETYQYGNRISKRNYQYYTNGKVKSIVTSNDIENYFMDYQNTENVMEVKLLLEQSDGIALKTNTEYREVYRNFVYDNNPKPYFGTANVFQFEPMPGYGDEAMLEKNLSKNNLIEFVNGTKWIHTYNENGYPATIEVKWKDIEFEKPLMYRITYREITTD